MKNKILGLGSVTTIGSLAFAIVACTSEEKSPPANNEVEPNVVTDLAGERDKIPRTLTTIDAANKLGQNFTADVIGADVTAKFKKITEVVSTGANKFYTKPISAGVTITAKVRTAYDASKKKIVLTLTVESGGKSEAKAVIILFESISLQTELDKLQDIMVAESASNAVANYDFAKQALFTNILTQVQAISGLFANGYFSHGSNKLLASTLASRVTISEIMAVKEYVVATRQLVLQVKLAKGNKNIISGTNTKEITITFGGTS